jgi:hypothetical protein
MSPIEAIKASVQTAIETMPYLDLETWDDDLHDGRPVTLREFYENTWQGQFADKLFSSVAAVAARAALDALADNVSEGMVEAGRAAWLDSAADYTLLHVSIGEAIKTALKAAKDEG